MPPRARLDAELVRRGLFGSREQSAAAIAEGRVLVAGQPARKPATAITADTPVTLIDPDRVEWASRGAHKLLGALEIFGDPERYDPPLSVVGRRCLDAGASTGGFTDVLLRADVAAVVAVDVGYGQIVWRLRTDPRVTVIDRTNVRHLTPDVLGGPVEVVVADLSFISLLVVLPALRGCTDPPADFVLLVKPQFEVGRERVGRGGVVRDPELRADAVRTVALAALELGLRIRGIAPSPLPGPAGNVEYLLWLSYAADLADPDAGLQGEALESEIVAQVSASPASGTART
ncbi:MAG TPA: TlyA family RNA methyltransferase [Frankiaceae bacterium]|nr:TlyA family RNA methyltransferase [Frankiaceae bacterium]